MNTADRRLITRVALRNYKSLAACDVELGPLTILVGPNGVGKSNFLDALRFTAQALRFSLDHALRERGGISEVRTRSADHLGSVAVRLDLRLSDATGWYGFEIVPECRGRYVVMREECVVKSSNPEQTGFFRRREGRTLASSIAHPPPADGSDRLYLLAASGYRPFRPVYDTLAAMGVYKLDPEDIRELQSPGPGDLLDRSGANAASVLDRIQSRSPDSARRIGEYLSAIVPGTVRVESKSIGPKLALEFLQQVQGEPDPRRFLANSVSDGTLHALGVLVALFQRSGSASESPGLVGIEEPETALHPAAAGVLTDVLGEASEHVQVIVTSHSADLLDRDAIPEESILAVDTEQGATRIAPLDETGRSTCQEGLFTAGELLRMDQLTPDPATAASRRRDLFRNEA